jgi:hypothetical protein
MTSENLAARALRFFGASRPVMAGWSARIARPLLSTRVHASLPFAIVGAWALAIRHANLRAMTDLGLVSVFPRATFLLLFLLTVSFCLSLARLPLNPVVALIHVIVLVVILYGVTAFLEPVPRFATAWKSVGIIDFIARHGSTNPEFDAFFNWPGFFSLGALITKVAGFHNALAIAAWAPLIFNLLFLAPLVVIFRWASDDQRVTWLGLWVFYSTNWVAQDYISNQAMGYTLWLSMLAALLTWFTPRPSTFAARAPLRHLVRALDPRQLLARLRVQSDSPVTNTAPQRRVVLLLLIVAMYSAIVTGHQLTPIPVILTVSGLILFARLETRLLAVIMTVLLAAWISYMTTAYLAGHASALTGSVGQVSQNLAQGVSKRVAGSHGHELIVKIRLIATLAIWLLAAAGVLRRLLASHLDVGMAIVAGAPAVLPGLQAYGGEVLLRAFIFSLPAVSFFIAALAFPGTNAGRKWLTIAGAAIVACLLLMVFQYTRYGNERLDSFTHGDYATVQAFYRLAPPGSTVYAGDENLPWRYRDYAAYHYRTVTDLPEWNAARSDTSELALRLRAALASSGGGYIIVTRSTSIAAGILENKPHTLDELVAALRVLPGLSEVYRNGDGHLFFLPRAPSPQAAGPASPAAHL